MHQITFHLFFFEAVTVRETFLLLMLAILISSIRRTYPLSSIGIVRTTNLLQI
jgi:hypothetical protein